MRQFDLQPPFPRRGALAEDLQDDGGAIQNLAVPGLLQIALLHRRQMRIDDDDFRFLVFRQQADLFHLAAAQQRRRYGPRQRRDLRHHHVQMNGGCQLDRLVQARLRIPQCRIRARSGSWARHG